MQQLFVSDLDGTLLNKQGFVSPDDSLIINNLIADHNFTIATGRALLSCRNLLKDIQFKLPVITSNGAIISFIDQPEPILVNSLSADLYVQVKKTFRNNGHRVFTKTFCRETLQYKLYAPTPQTRGQQWYIEQRKKHGDTQVYIQDFNPSTSTDDIMQVFVCEEFDPLSDVLKILQGTYADKVSVFLTKNHYVPGLAWLEVSNINGNKGFACQWVCDYLGLSAKDLYVFGDEANDVSMFKVAKNSYAMAVSHPELKKLSSEVLTTDEPNPVLAKIMQLKN